MNESVKICYFKNKVIFQNKGKEKIAIVERYVFIVIVMESKFFESFRPVVPDDSDTVK